MPPDFYTNVATWPGCPEDHTWEVPEGWHKIAFRAPKVGEHYLYSAPRTANAYSLHANYAMDSVRNQTPRWILAKNDVSGDYVTVKTVKTFNVLGRDLSADEVKSLINELQEALNS